MDQLLIALPVLLLSIVAHEYAHGWVALREGDPTAAMLGRLTWNPIPHIDPIGSILVPVVLAILPGGILFGWAKPVPVNSRNFRNYKRGDILVSLAGVAANLVLAVIFAMMIVLTIWGQIMLPAVAETWQLLRAMAEYGILINLILIFFNLLPIPPLDGSHIMYHLLPPELGARYRELSRFGMILVIAFIFLGGFRILAVPVFGIFSWMRGLAISVATLVI